MGYSQRYSGRYFYPTLASLEEALRAVLDGEEQEEGQNPRDSLIDSLLAKPGALGGRESLEDEDPCTAQGYMKIRSPSFFSLKVYIKALTINLDDYEVRPATMWDECLSEIRKLAEIASAGFVDAVYGEGDYPQDEVQRVRIHAGGEEQDYSDINDIFISYRRSDTSLCAVRLHQILRAGLGHDKVFCDVESIPIGADFVKEIEFKLSKCGYLMVLIGNGWLDAKDSNGIRRIDSNEDYVRMEVEAGFAHKLTVIPVLVGGAIMPSALELPDSLRSLARLNAASLEADLDEDSVNHLLRRVYRGEFPKIKEPKSARPDDHAGSVGALSYRTQRRRRSLGDLLRIAATWSVQLAGAILFLAVVFTVEISWRLLKVIYRIAKYCIWTIAKYWRRRK